MSRLVHIQRPCPTRHKTQKYSIGIDFGTTNSVICTYHNGLIAFANESKISRQEATPQFITMKCLIKDSKNNCTRKVEGGNNNLGNASMLKRAVIPSVVSFNRCGEVFVGKEAVARIGQPDCFTIRSAKRVLEIIDSKKDIDKLPSGWFMSKKHNLPSIKVFEEEYTCLDILIIIMQHLIATYKNTFGEHATNLAVITTPAYFTERSRGFIKAIGERCGIQVLRIINEPTAAAICYGLEKNEESCYLVFDLGGGTFDVSVLRFQQGVFQVLATGGDVFLGGDNFDQAMINMLQSNIGSIPEVSGIEEISKQAKHHLSKYKSFSITITQNGQKTNLSISRNEYEKAIMPMVNRMIHITQSALYDSGLEPSEIKSILLIGGATKMPIIKATLQKHFECEILNTINPDLTVATGAAIQAACIDGREPGVNVIDVTPLSIGIEMMGGIMERVINRNTPIPTTESINITNFHNQQTAIDLNILQGERDIAQECQVLGNLVIPIEPSTPGTVQVEVHFALDQDGILTVSSHTPEGKKMEVEINTLHHLKKLDLKKTIAESINCSADDYNNATKKRILVRASMLATQAENLMPGLDISKQSKVSILIKKFKDEISRGENLSKIQSIQEELEALFANAQG
jgi:molecular chaperone HscA